MQHRALVTNQSGGVVLHAHTAERYHRPPGSIACNTCCCCCCCCLHSLGGLVGAAAAAAKPPKRDDGGGQSCASWYWGVLTLGTIIAAIIAWRYSPPNRSDLWILLAILYPLVQLVASFVTAVAVATYYSGQECKDALSHLGKITWWTILGVAIGGVVLLFLAPLILR